MLPMIGPCPEYTLVPRTPAPPLSAVCSARARRSTARQYLTQQREIGDEALHLRLSRLLVRRTQDGRGMHRRHHVRRPARADPLPSLASHTELRTEQSLGRGGAQADERGRLDEVQLGLEPGQAGADFELARLGVNAPLALRFP